MRSASALLRSLARAALWILATCSFLTFLAYILFSITPGFQNSSGFEGWKILYEYAKQYGVSQQLFTRNYTTSIVFSQGMVLFSALLMFAYTSIPAGEGFPTINSLKAKVHRVLSIQLPHCGFWKWWCGGLSLLDFSLVAFWVFYNAWYACWLLDALGKQAEKRAWLDRLGYTAAAMLEPNIMLLFMPIAHSSFLNVLTGLPFDKMIRYHRWLGHGTMWVLTVHAFAYYIYWGVEHEFWTQFSDWNVAEANNLAGTIAYIAGLVLWVSSLHWFRRKYFEWFFQLHIWMFVLFFAFSMMHYSNSWQYFLPGMLVYFADLILRAGQLANVTTVTAASVSDGGQVATLQLRASKGVASIPLRECFVCVPALRRFQWHPFSVASGPSVDGKMTLCIKRYGHFTSELLARLQAREPLALRVAGPIGNDAFEREWENYDCLVLIGGGIGCSPLLCMLSDMLERRASNSSIQTPSHVHLAWTARDTDEFSVMPAAILRAASSPDGWLKLSLYHTGKAALLEGCKAAPVLEQSSADSLKKASSTVAGADVPRSAFPADAPFHWKWARALQPRTLNGFQQACSSFFVYAGSFCSLYLVCCWIAEDGLYSKLHGLGESARSAWKYGLVWSFAIPIMALGLPYLLAVFPVHLYRYICNVRAYKQGASNDLVGSFQDQPSFLASQGCSVVVGRLTCGGESGLELNAGRPSMPALLEEAAAAHPTGSVGVYIAGPARMMSAAQLEVDKMNGRSIGKPYFDCHLEATFM